MWEAARFSGWLAELAAGIPKATTQLREDSVHQRGAIYVTIWNGRCSCTVKGPGYGSLMNRTRSEISSFAPQEHPSVITGSGTATDQQLDDTDTGHAGWTSSHRQFQGGFGSIDGDIPNERSWYSR